MNRKTLLLIAAAIAVGAVLAIAQNDMSNVQIKSTQLAEHVYMLEGTGGNMAVLTGPQGTLLVDDEFAALSEKIEAAIASAGGGKVRFLLNTHWHGDHTGGNENFAKAGVAIFAQDNVRKRMSVAHNNELFGWKSEASPAAALPVVTFDDSLTFHINGETVTCFHAQRAHTDGDVMVWFRNANVLHMGDCLFNPAYPVLDVSTGGSIGGMIDASNRVLAMVANDTKIIPGHGPLATRADVQAFRDMLVTVRDRVKRLIVQKKTSDQVVAAKPLTDLDEKWGKGFVKADLFVKVVYADLAQK